MGLAYLNGGGGGSGIRHKKITVEDYKKLSYADRHNPYVVWILLDAKATDVGGIIGDGVKLHACVWSTYCSLPDDDKLDPQVAWIIIDKNAKDLQALGYGTNESQGSKLYNISADLDYAGVTKTINALIDRVNELSSALTRVTETLNSN